MLKNIIKQIWNQRRMNGWIFFEIIIAGFFLWTVIDPVYVLMVHHGEPKGYEESGRYVLQLGAYGHSHGRRDTTITNNQRKEAFLRIAQMVSQQPEVEAAYISIYNSLPNDDSWSGGQYFPDTLSLKEEREYIHSQHYFIMVENGSDIFHTLGIKDVKTGKDLVIPADAVSRHLCFVSEQFAQTMFGSTQVAGQKVYSYNNQVWEIGGVFQNMQTRDYTASYPLFITVNQELSVDDYMHINNLIVFRLKEGVNFDSFSKRFKKEVAPHMNQGNFYYKGLQSLREKRHDIGEMYGVYNQFRLKFSLAIFTLLCIFLGMVGTFWVRCNARRQEIGLMRSLGASRQRITNQFLLESGVLLTGAFFFSLVLVLNFVVIPSGMTPPNVTGDANFAHVSEWLSSKTQFCMVSLLTYLALLFIALTGTFIPVYKAMKTLPADALRDE